MLNWSAKRPVIAAVAAILALSACGSGDDSGATGKKDSDGVITVKLGVVGPKTGPASLYYKYMDQNFETFSDDFEEKYKVRFEIIGEDDQASPEETARAVSRLINEEAVHAILGPPLSGNALQVADVIQKSQIPWLLAGPNADEAINYDIQPNWAFQTNFTNQQIMEILGTRLFADNNKVGIVYSADGFGQSNLDHLKSWAKENGKKLTAEESLQPGSSDANAIIKRFKSAGVDSVFMGITQGADTATVTRAIEQAGYEPKTIMTTGTILTNYKTIAEPSQWENIQIVDPRNFLEGGDKEILDAVQEATGEAPAIPTNNISTYAMLDIYAQAVAEVGDANDREAVRKAMEDIETVHIGSLTIEKPFTTTDHKLYDDDPANWLTYGFDEKFNLKLLGTAEECLEKGC
ncbi:ABC-type branched-subunit amino acid transport system substrate-binding protein [Nocardioides daedukensis]|uniref:ABC-type branched-subunit amino acid transport system substrate-binding protein n=1 Tax=Nocardioides daedukensis TaxID=634462 RepID=A0A7Y9UU35_9ACTN|nr:ABC transporter substrate-binding protein [Nocardioides daedukensis]NYG59879.1 ABC-type branched-subunit amino acid transport system substrate-binding protein [Nocardioides daedukensis]